MGIAEKLLTNARLAGRLIGFGEISVTPLIDPPPSRNVFELMNRPQPTKRFTTGGGAHHTMLVCAALIMEELVAMRSFMLVTTRRITSDPLNTMVIKCGDVFSVMLRVGLGALSNGIKGVMEGH